MDSRELVRLCRLSDIYSRMSDEERRAFGQLTASGLAGVDGVSAELRRQGAMIERQGAVLDDVSRRVGRYPFVSDLLANVAGNVITDGVAWLVARMVRR